MELRKLGPSEASRRWPASAPASSRRRRRFEQDLILQRASLHVLTCLKQLNMQSYEARASKMSEVSRRKVRSHVGPFTLEKQALRASEPFRTSLTTTINASEALSGRQIGSDPFEDHAVKSRVGMKVCETQLASRTIPLRALSLSPSRLPTPFPTSFRS